MRGRLSKHVGVLESLLEHELDRQYELDYVGLGDDSLRVFLQSLRIRAAALYDLVTGTQGGCSGSGHSEPLVECSEGCSNG